MDFSVFVVSFCFVVFAYFSYRHFFFLSSNLRQHRNQHLIDTVPLTPFENNTVPNAKFFDNAHYREKSPKYKLDQTNETVAIMNKSDVEI